MDARRLMFSVDVLDGSPVELADAVDRIGAAIMAHPLVVRVIAPDHRTAAHVDAASAASAVRVEREKRRLREYAARLDRAEKEATQSDRGEPRPLRAVLDDRLTHGG